MGPRMLPVAPNVAPSVCDVKNPSETKKDKNPSRINDLGFCVEPDGTSGDVLKPCYIWSIITWPKPEHDTCVAPSIRRAKS